MSDKNPFAAVDKLVDFAKGTAIQEQMTKSMNETIANMRIPGAGNPLAEETAQGSEKSKEVEDEN